MYGIANIVLQVGINMLGTDSMAGWTAFNKFDDYYWPISNAIGIAVMTYVGRTSARATASACTSRSTRGCSST